jgi:pilus assembly protein CpaE
VQDKTILVLDRGDELAGAIRAAVAGIDADRFGAGTRVIAWSRLNSVQDLLVTEGPFDVIVAGPSLATRSGLRRLALLADDVPNAALVLAFAKRPECTLREIVQCGAIDLLQLPTSKSELVVALERALDVSVRRSEVDLATFQPVANETSRSARLFTVGSATGGCGKTFYATNMALFLARQTHDRVVLVDLDLQFGEVSTALRLRPKYTIADALQFDEDDSDFDLAAHIDEFLVQHESGFWVLAAPKDPAEADRITAAQVTRVLEVLRSKYDYVIVDTPAALTEIVLAAFDLSEHVFVLGSLDLPSVRNLGLFLQTIEKLRISTENISLVLNKAEPDIGIDVSQVVRLFPQGFRSVLPYAREAARSINTGTPVLASDPSSEVARKIVTGLADFLPAADRARMTSSPVPERGTGLGLFRRKTPQKAGT